MHNSWIRKHYKKKWEKRQDAKSKKTTEGKEKLKWQKRKKTLRNRLYKKWPRKEFKTGKNLTKEKFSALKDKRSLKDLSSLLGLTSNKEEDLSCFTQSLKTKNTKESTQYRAIKVSRSSTWAKINWPKTTAVYWSL